MRSIMARTLGYSTVRALLERHARSADAANRRDGPGVRHFINVKQLDQDHTSSRLRWPPSDPYMDRRRHPNPKAMSQARCRRYLRFRFSSREPPSWFSSRRTRQGTLRHMPLTFRHRGAPPIKAKPPLRAACSVVVPDYLFGRLLREKHDRTVQMQATSWLCR